MAERKADRRPKRTRAQLHEALLALVVERGYQRITVQDILDRANIGRSTFYLHFRDKDELLLSGMTPLRETLMQVVRSQPAGAKQCLSFIPAFFEHGEFYRQAYSALAGAARLAAEEQIADMLRDLVHEDLRLHARSRRIALPIDAVSHCLAAAVMGIVSWWVAQKRPLPPEQISQLALTMLQPVAERAFAATLLN